MFSGAVVPPPGVMYMAHNDVELTILPVPGVDGSTGFFLRLMQASIPFSAYITGDTLFTEHTRELQHTHGYSNLLVMYVGAERHATALRSADAKEAMQIVYRMQPIAAVHHSTFSHSPSPSRRSSRRWSHHLQNRLRNLREGGSFEKNI